MKAAQLSPVCCLSGPEGWRAATAQGVASRDILYRWSPKHQDLEVISKNSLPVYLYAPGELSPAPSMSCSLLLASFPPDLVSPPADSYLGNQLLSYGQNLSFSLRLDRGVRHPSTQDVILEGAGLTVSASLGDLRSIVPCGQKISYSFRSEG